ncbi:MarR family transcriptional regulator [Streptomyces sp. MS06]|uniref:MarR family transcriptional regulator n=1 Tax=Streptomyces sp. MS06 TaxID=3385974 RepID=UPI00399F96C1
MAGNGEDERDPFGGYGYDLLSRALAGCAREGFSGALRVNGSPGGTFHLRSGLVVAVESPGAPSPQALLLRSGRITGEQWERLVDESRGARWPAEALIAHGYAGTAQLGLVCVMALQDAAFAVVAGRIGGCERVAHSKPLAPVALGEPPQRVLGDAARKVLAVTELPHPVRPDRERPVPGSQASVSSRLSTLRNELLDHADGRRSARDLAFCVGRGLYPVTVEIGWMLGEGLLRCTGAPAPVPVLLPADGRGVQPREPTPDPLRQPLPAPAALPRRRPGSSGITEVRPPRRSGPTWKDFFRLRHPTAD